MIRAGTDTQNGFADRLAERARKIAEARLVRRRLARRGDLRGWRSAALLWPWRSAIQRRGEG